MLVCACKGGAWLFCFSRAVLFVGREPGCSDRARVCSVIYVEAFVLVLLGVVFVFMSEDP